MKGKIIKKGAKDSLQPEMLSDCLNNLVPILQDRVKNPLQSEMLPEYDFRGGIRGQYASRYREGNNIILLHPDLAKIFPDSQSVNKALLMLVELAQSIKEDITDIGGFAEP